MRKVLALCFVALILFSTATSAQDFFLKIDGIEGEVTNVGHENQIMVYSYSQGLVSCLPTNQGGGNACKVSATPLAMMIRLDKSNIAIKEALLTGKKIAFADFYQKKTGGDGNPYVYYQLRLENVSIITSQEGGSNGSGDVASLSIEIAFTKIAWAYRSQKPDGSVGTVASTGWDLTTNKPWNFF